VLKSVSASYTFQEPIKEGACGAPAVLELASIGRGRSTVELDPPARLTCDMVVALDKWLREDVQPLARKHLGGPVVQIQTMSSYSCRNAYGRKLSRLSEHGRANALDIGGFKTHAGRSAYVLTSWGLTAREIKAIVAKAEAKRQAEAAAAKAAGSAADVQDARLHQSGKVTAAGAGAPAPAAASAATLGVADRATSPPGASITPLSVEPRTESFGMSPSRLGGPKSKGEKPSAAKRAESVKAGEDIPESERISFMRDVHARACKHFGTVLGPEANNAHKNHFHLDMAGRKRGNFCE
jgi:hypothetical protein